MNRCMLSLTIVGCLVLGLAGVVRADQDTDMRAEIARLQQRLNEVEAQQSQNWLNERRAEEIKSLVQDVLTDADTRASLMADGSVAGHDGSHFFLASADGGFLLKFAGQVQIRFGANFNASSGAGVAGDDEDEGFQIRRTKLAFSGHVEAGGQWNYFVRLATNSTSGAVSVEDVWISRQIADNMTVKAGLFKLPFMREELTSSSRQQAVERSGVNELFSAQRSEQLQLQVKPADNIRALVSISDGSNEGFSTLGADPVEFAVTARIDVALQGSLAQTTDFSAWSGEATGLFVGGAVHYQLGDGYNTVGVNAANSSVDYFAWTVDGSFESNGFNVFAAFVANHIDSSPTSGITEDGDQMGFVVQGGYMVIPDKLEPFVRLEYMEDDDVANAGADEDAWLLTFGVNYYFEKGHDAKFTADVVWLVDGTTYSGLTNGHGASAQAGTGSGFSEAVVDEGTVLLRLQFQLLF